VRHRCDAEWRGNPWTGIFIRVSAPASQADRLNAALSGRYRLERELGAGGMATVYLAEDLKHDRKVAIKVLKPELAAVLGAERFLAEIKTTASLQHPHILPLLDSGTADGQFFYVMPYVTGETLRARLDRERQLPVDDALGIAREVADALAAAHAVGIIHRDIKPENILLQGGHALVADFGIALAVQTAGGSRMTQTGLSLGTPQYMSPEQAMGERTIDARSDIYALGAVTYEMLVGEPPFTGPSVQAIVARVMSEEPRGLTQQRKSVPADVDDAILQALEKLPADRFATAGEFAAAIAGGGSRPSSTRRSAMRTPQISRSAVALAFVTVVATTLAAWGWLRPRIPPPVVRYVVSLDSVPELHLWVGETAISPDGSMIVHGGGLSGNLRVRRREALGFTPIPGTEGAMAPCFSPNGSQIAFSRDGKLVMMPVTGGLQVVIADSIGAASSCAWSEDGFIYRIAAGRGYSALQRSRPSAGAEVTTVTTADSTKEESTLFLPEPLPNGKVVLLQASYLNGRTAIIAVNIASGSHTVLVPDGARARYARDGHLVYSTNDGKLWSVGFDPKRLAISGEPVEVGGGVPSTMAGPVDFAVSFSGTLAYGVDNSSALADLVLVSRDGREVAVDTAWRAAFASPALSADGARLAVTVQTGPGRTGTSDIWTRRLGGGAPQKFTLEAGLNSEAAFTPDGRSIAFLNAGSGGSKTADLFVQPLDGGAKAQRILQLTRSISEQEWSTRGGQVVVRTTTGHPGAGDILAGPAGASAASMKPVAASSSRSEYSPSISPDGRFVAYSSNETGRFEVYVVPFPDPGNAKWQVTNTGGRSPRWSRKGGEIFYVDLTSNLIAAKIVTSPAFAVTGHSVLFNAAKYSTLSISRHNFDVMPDDQRFLMIRRRGGSPSAQLVVVENLFDPARRGVAP
jgi:serine/threonine protein kinase